MPSEANDIMREIYEGIHGNHVVGQLLSFRALREGYYWQPMKSNCMEFTKKYDKCQCFAPLLKAYPEELIMIISRCPFVV